MELPGKKIASVIEKELKKEVKKQKKRIKLSVFIVGDAPEQLSFVRIKAKIAKQLGIQFETIHLKEVPSFEVFMHKIKEKTSDPTVNGIIIQQPLPAQLQTDSIYDYIPLEKEIEGHKRKTPFTPPIGLAILTALKYIYAETRLNSQMMVTLKGNRDLFGRKLKSKRVVIIGRGITGGLPIGKTLTDVKVNYIGINSQTPEPAQYIKEADIIITAVGKKVITPENIKEGAVLLNVGLRKENGSLKGDYDEKEVKSIASWYSPTPGGIGPIDVLYLFSNLIQAAKMQK